MSDLISKSSVFELIERKCVDGCLEVGGRTLIDAYELIDDVSDLPIVTVDKLMEVYDKEIRDKAIEKFAEALTDKIEAKYCRGNLTSQYVGMQTCDWIKEIAEQMKEVGE